jgi:hypothetical protein
MVILNNFFDGDSSNRSWLDNYNFQTGEVTPRLYVGSMSKGPTFDTAIYHEKQRLWYGANQGGSENFKVLIWSNAWYFSSYYGGSFNTTVVTVTAGGPGTANSATTLDEHLRRLKK